MYIYKFKYTSGDEQLCALESRYLFGAEVENKYVITDSYIDVSRSAFVKYCIKVLLQAASLDMLVEKIKECRLSYESFKVKYLDILDKSDFDEKRRAEYSVGYEIIGWADVHNPSIVLGLTKINGMWYLGEYRSNNGDWHKQDMKPRKYSNSLPAKVARAIINMAVGSDIDKRVIDPCCGIGTVILEGLSMGVDIRGSDINYKVVIGARENLSYFGYPNVVSKASIHNLEGHYDVAIIDLPYGIMSETSEEKQMDIVKSAGRIAEKVIVVSIKDMYQALTCIGFRIVDSCDVLKGTFKRHIAILEENN